MNAELRPIRTAAEETLAGLVAARLAAGPGEGRIGELRRAAAADFAENGLPHRRVEEWKYTDLRAALRAVPPLAAPSDMAAEAEAGFKALRFAGAARIVFVNGALAHSVSDLAALPAGVTLVPLASALAAGHPLTDLIGSEPPARYDAALALNTALLGEGLVLKVEAGAKVEQAIQIAHVFTADAPVSAFTRFVVSVGDGARLSLIESFQGRDGIPYLADTAMELFAGDGAHVDLVRLQEEGDGTIHLATLATELARDVRLRLFALTAGAALSRYTVYGRFAGHDAHAGIRGATLLKGRQHADITLMIDHAVARCESRELFKTVLADAARGVFQGKIVVRPDAQKTDGRMMSQSLLLSDDAEMDNKPELEIFADDVQCGHGATSGALDDKMLFYLMSRGLPRAEAETLLIRAFVGEAVEYVEDEAVREMLIARTVAWLEKRAG